MDEMSGFRMGRTGTRLVPNASTITVCTSGFYKIQGISYI